MLPAAYNIVANLKASGILPVTISSDSAIFGRKRVEIFHIGKDGGLAEDEPIYDIIIPEQGNFFHYVAIDRANGQLALLIANASGIDYAGYPKGEKLVDYLMHNYQARITIDSNPHAELYPGRIFYHEGLLFVNLGPITYYPDSCFAYDLSSRNFAHSQDLKAFPQNGAMFKLEAIVKNILEQAVPDIESIPISIFGGEIRPKEGDPSMLEVIYVIGSDQPIFKNGNGLTGEIAFITEPYETPGTFNPYQPRIPGMEIRVITALTLPAECFYG